jgi:hypothetical protein
VFARQPFDLARGVREVRQWLCVPPFRAVCPLQAHMNYLCAVVRMGVSKRYAIGQVKKFVHRHC